MKTPHHRVNPLFEQSRRLRREQTQSEYKLWQELRSRRLGNYKFRRQHIIANYIVDFYCAEVKLIVEIEGKIHIKQQDEDLKRKEELVSWGYKLIRFRNREIEENIDLVKEKILRACQVGRI